MNHIVTYRGEDMTLTEAIRRSGSVHSAGAVAKRLKSGWALDRALHLPVMVTRGVRMRMRPLSFAGGRQ